MSHESPSKNIFERLVDRATGPATSETSSASQKELSDTDFADLKKRVDEKLAKLLARDSTTYNTQWYMNTLEVLQAKHRRSDLALLDMEAMMDNLLSSDRAES